jgi:hypothetical protein
VNNKEDVFDELDALKMHSEAPSSEESDSVMSTIDLVDNINRAAFRRRLDYDRSWRRHSGAADK